MTDRPPARAFTLVELLVVVTTLVLLLACLLPNLQANRRRSMGTTSFQNMHVLYQAHVAYWGDNQDAFINPLGVQGTFQNYWGTIRIPGYPRDYWDFGSYAYTTLFSPYWASLLSLNSSGHPTHSLPEMFAPEDGLAQERAFATEQYFQFSLDQIIIDGSYWLSPTTWINPTVLATQTTGRFPINTNNLNHWRRNHSSDTRFPSLKVLFWERFDFSRTTRLGANGQREHLWPSWVNPEANTKSAAVDGSIGTVSMQPLFDRIKLVGNSAAGALPITPLGKLRDYANRQAFDAFDLSADPFEPTADWPAFFFMTRGGIQGRDLLRPVIDQTRITPIRP